MIKGIIDHNVDIPYGPKEGFYFAVTANIRWKDIYQGVSNELYSRKLVDNNELNNTDSKAYDDMSKVLRCPPAFVDVSVAGK